MGVRRVTNGAIVSHLPVGLGKKMFITIVYSEHFVYAVSRKSMLIYIETYYCKYLSPNFVSHWKLFCGRP